MKSIGRRHRVTPGPAPARHRAAQRSLRRRLRADDGAAVAEFPMVAVLIVMIGLLIVQAALIVHTRNTLVDAAVQGAHHAALAGSTPQDGAERAERLIDERFGNGLDAAATATLSADGTIHVHVTASLPLVGLYGPSGTLSVAGRALDEESM
ncbi:MAG: TadE/TadG family type IV pilus assembly protein [Brachybacterium sp.]